MSLMTIGSIKSGSNQKAVTLKGAGKTVLGAGKAAGKYIINSTLRNTDFLVPTAMWFSLNSAQTMFPDFYVPDYLKNNPFSGYSSPPLSFLPSCLYLLYSSGASVLTSVAKIIVDPKEKILLSNSGNSGYLAEGTVSLLKGAFISMIGLISAITAAHEGFSPNYGAVIGMTIATLLPGVSIIRSGYPFPYRRSFYLSLISR
ncbi:MAG: hypothetical protein PHH14_00185 [Candidatus Margulisbacteria bacterium]|nr:hypothetical protein [Candidatus Margulisiibacteriota bacterium]